MTQFNLLPDVKLQYLQAQRIKRLGISLSAIVGLASLAIFILLILFVDVAQKKQLDDLNSNIATSTRQLSSNTNLNKILTIQNQLKTLPTIESETPVASRLFGYVTQLTPSQATISSLNLDFTQNTLSITGDADTLATVNQYVDTLKFTTYKTATTSNAAAFSQVVLSSFGYSQNSSAGKPATFTITLDFDPTIFSNASSVSLSVPQITTTRSILDQPTDLFVKDSSTNSNMGGQ